MHKKNLKKWLRMTSVVCSDSALITQKYSNANFKPVGEIFTDFLLEF